MKIIIVIIFWAISPSPSGELTNLERVGTQTGSEEKPRTSRPDWTGWSSAGRDAGLPSARIGTVQTQSAEPHLPPAWPDRSCSLPKRREGCCWDYRPVRNESGTRQERVKHMNT